MKLFFIVAITAFSFGCREREKASESKAVVGKSMFSSEVLYVFPYFFENPNFPIFKFNDESGKEIVGSNALCLYTFLANADDKTRSLEIFKIAKSSTDYPINDKELFQEINSVYETFFSVRGLLSSIYIDLLGDDIEGIISSQKQAQITSEVSRARLDTILEKSKKYVGDSGMRCPKHHPRSRI